ncbi:MAG: Glutamate--tRNA ligase [Candidatus Thorarchaeota archaeon]|nr:MAG: Glutamate--tRNA ligase [Candidatus Thorarchaeota archaeon]
MSDLEFEVRKVVLENAVKYEGKPSVKSVMAALLGTRADLRPRAKEVKDIVQVLVVEIEEMGLDAQIRELKKIAPELLEQEESEPEKKEMPPLPNDDKWDKIVMRLAPFPSGPLHIGNARMVVLNDYYVKRYDGELILVFDDTIGSAEKQVEPDAFDLIPEGLDYLGVDYHKTVYKSDRLDLFYKYAVDLIKLEEAYVCDCDAALWRNEHKVKMIPCVCRSLSVEENLARWERMLDGTYEEKEAAVRLKTGMNDPDPAMRDHVILRISETDHPRVGSKYRVWPLLEYSWGIDDHELGISHIIRGKDLVKEGKIEQHIWNIYGWQHPELIYYGRLKFQDATLSKSKSRKEVQEGTYTGWNDPRTWSLQSLERRGIHPDAVRKAMLDLGLSLVDIAISMKAVYSENRSLRDADAPRLFFVQNPVWTTLQRLPPEITYGEAPVHPDFPERGVRKIELVPNPENSLIEVGISERDYEKLDAKELVRLKDLANFVLEKGKSPALIFQSRDVDDVRDAGGRMIHWIPKHDCVPVEMTMIDGEVITGLAESGIKDMKSGTFLQFERVGFVKIYSTDDGIKLAFAH